jgi:hypothetical protein
VFAVALAVSCRPGLPRSVATFADNSEQFSAPAEGKIGTSYVLGELAVEMRVVPPRPGPWYPREEYHIVAHGRPVATIGCVARRAGIHYAFGEPDDLSCGDGRGWSLRLFYSNWWFPREMNHLLRTPLDPNAATGNYAIEAEMSDAANVFRFWPARFDPESSAFAPLPGTKPVAAVVHQPFRNTILLARDAPDHDALLAAAAIVMGMADRVQPGPNPCSPGSLFLPGETKCVRGPE